MRSVYSEVGLDGSGDEVLDQAAIGEGEEEFIYMRRKMDDVEVCERSPVQVKYREAVESRIQYSTSDSL